MDRTNWRILANGINQVESAVARQLDCQNQAKYRGTIWVKGESGSRLRLVSVREVGTKGRAHIHTLSDIQFIDHDWITERCLRNGLGFPEYQDPPSAASRWSHSGPSLQLFVEVCTDDRHGLSPKNLRLYSASMVAFLNLMLSTHLRKCVGPKSTNHLRPNQMRHWSWFQAGVFNLISKEKHLRQTTYPNTYPQRHATNTITPDLIPHQIPKPDTR